MQEATMELQYLRKKKSFCYNFSDNFQVLTEANVGVSELA